MIWWYRFCAVLAFVGMYAVPHVNAARYAVLFALGVLAVRYFWEPNQHDHPGNFWSC